MAGTRVDSTAARCRAARVGGWRAVGVRAIGAATLAAAIAVSLPAAAGAASAPFQIGSFTESSSFIEIPSIDVDASGTAYVAWPDLPNNKIDYCVLPNGASTCAESGALSPVLEPGANPSFQPPFGPSLNPFGHVVEVMVDGGTVSIIAGTVGPSDEAQPTSGGWLPETEMWQAPDGTGNFTLVNNGASVAYAQPRPLYDYQGHPMVAESYFTDGVVVPGSGELGEFDFTPLGPPSFEAFPQSNPPACSELSQPACPFATLQPGSDPDQVGNYSFLVGREIASESGSNPGILAINLTKPYGSGSLACGSPSNPESTDAYMYGSGLESPTNDYNISPGQPNSAWRVGATEVPDECPAGVSAAGGGPSGFGLFESYEHAGVFELRYRPFDSATAAFDKPAATVDPNSSAATLGLSQDGAGNIYATGFVQNVGPSTPNASATSGAPLALFYSADGGQTWKGPGPLESTVQPGFERSESAVGSDGKGWMVITAAGSLYALEFSAADAGNSFSAQVSPVAQVANRVVTVGLSCYAIPCSISTTMSSNLARAARARRGGGSAVVGRGSARLTRHGVQHVKIRLSRAAARSLKAHHKLTVLLKESTTLGPYHELRTVRLTLRSRRHR